MNSGTVNVIRQKQFVGSLIPFDVYVDNQYAGSIKNGNTLSFPVYYGNHIISIQTVDKTVNQQILLSDTSRVANIECNCSMGFLTGRPNLIRIYYN